MKFTTPPIKGSFQQFCESGSLPSKGWVNIRTGKVERVSGGTHGDEVYEDPDRFGVKREVEELEKQYGVGTEDFDEDDASFTQECLGAALQTGNWVRFEDFMNEVNMDAKTLPLARRALNIMADAGYNIYVSRGIRIDTDEDNLHLEDMEAIEFFLRHGRAKRQR